LTGGGFRAGTVSNSSQHATAVTYGTGAQAPAGAIAGLLGAPAPTADTTLPKDSISVVLGTGFTPPTDLARQAKQRTTPTASAPSSSLPPAPAAGDPQGLPVGGNGLPCVD